MLNTVDLQLFVKIRAIISRTTFLVKFVGQTTKLFNIKKKKFSFRFRVCDLLQNIAVFTRSKIDFQYKLVN